MGREVKRVPLDFDWPLKKVWEGFLAPERFAEKPCPACKNGYAPHAQHLRDLWYGRAPFDPSSTGSERLSPRTPAVRAFAERNIAAAPEFYGTGEQAIVREAHRMATLWNGQWCHHLSQEDVDALVAGNRLREFTHTWNPETRWQKIEPPVIPSAAQVNEWSLSGFGHDAINEGMVVQARCQREGQICICPTCDGHASLEAYEGQREEAEAWEPTEPPTGEGWQLWETVSEGSPVSPVFGSAEDLAQWLTTEDGGKAVGPSRRPLSIEHARGFVGAGWAPTLISDSTGMHDGAAYVGAHTNQEDHE